MSQPQPQTSFIELLADLEHEQWIELTKYLHDLIVAGWNPGDTSPENDKILFKNVGTMLLDFRRLYVPYKQLTEKQKDSDRKFAIKVWDLINKYYHLEPKT